MRYEPPHEIVAWDIRGNPIYADENESYFDTDIGLVCIDNNAQTDLYYYMIKQNFQIKTNIDLWKEWVR
ncbi:hypothetical protein NHG33_06570 [Aerococcaceae bacterium NML130460]|nr:hypothetical protein [Aerococcaceae bacterium NML130460]